MCFADSSSDTVTNEMSSLPCAEVVPCDPVQVHDPYYICVRQIWLVLLFTKNEYFTHYNTSNSIVPRPAFQKRRQSQPFQPVCSRATPRRSENRCRFCRRRAFCQPFLLCNNLSLLLCHSLLYLVKVNIIRVNR